MTSGAAATRVRGAIGDLSCALDALQSALAELEHDAGDRSDAHNGHADQRQQIPAGHEVGVSEAAAALGVSRSTVYAMCRDGRLAHRRTGSRSTIPVSALPGGDDAPSRRRPRTAPPPDDADAQDLPSRLKEHATQLVRDITTELNR